MNEKYPIGLSGRGPAGEFSRESEGVADLDFHPILNRTQERMLFTAFRAGNNRTNSVVFKPEFRKGMKEWDSEKWVVVLAPKPEISELIARCNHRLVKKASKDFNSSGPPKNDILSAGMIGLLEAIKRYDPDHPKQAKFSTYAAYWIRLEMLKTVKEHYGLSKTAFEGIGKVLQIQYAYQELWHRDPTREELDKQLRYNYSTIGNGQRKQILTSFFSRVNELTRSEYDTASNYFDVDTNADSSLLALKKLETERLQSVVQGAIVSLEAEEKFIVGAMFGIGTKKRSLQAIATYLGVSVEVVSSRLESALTRLQHNQQIGELRKELDITQTSDTHVPKAVVIYEADDTEIHLDTSLPKIDQVKTLCLAEYTPQQISNRLGITVNIVYKYRTSLRRDGKLPQRIPIQSPADRRAEAQDDDTRAVAQYLKENPRYFMHEQVKRGRRQETVIFDQQVQLLLDRGYRHNEIAAMLHTTLSRVANSSRWLRNN